MGWGAVCGVRPVAGHEGRIRNGGLIGDKLTRHVHIWVDWTRNARL